MKVATMSRVASRPGIAERLSCERLRVPAVLVRAKPWNRGRVYVGDATVNSGDPGLAPGRSLGIRSAEKLDLFDLFVLTQAPGEGVDVYFSSVHKPRSAEPHATPTCPFAGHIDEPAHSEKEAST